MGHIYAPLLISGFSEQGFGLGLRQQPGKRHSDLQPAQEEIDPLFKLGALEFLYSVVWRSGDFDLTAGRVFAVLERLIWKISHADGLVDGPGAPELTEISAVILDWGIENKNEQVHPIGIVPLRLVVPIVSRGQEYQNRVVLP